MINALKAQYYFRNTFEVDAVIKKGEEVLPIEVKYGQADPKSLVKFLDKFQVKKGILVSKDTYQKEKRLEIIPLWRFLLKAGKI